MRREEKTALINGLAEQIGSYAHYYLTDISGLNAASTASLRKACYEKEVVMVVVKNTLLCKALEAAGKSNTEIEATLTGATAVMFSNVGNVPAKLIQDYRKAAKSEKPLLKAAYVQECVYVGEQTLVQLVNVKSRDELIGDIITLLQSPAQNLISALTGAAGNKVAGIVKALEER